jgi:nitroreductase
MDFSEVVKRRYSVRAFRECPVDETALQSILQAACDAPSAGNMQAFEIIVVRDSGRRQQIARAALQQSFIAQAPVALVFLANPDRNRDKYGTRGAELYSVQDATVACAYAQLAATAAGLGSCWVGAFDEGAVRRIAGAPASWRPVAILPIGHPAELPGPRVRRPIQELVREATAVSR